MGLISLVGKYVYEKHPRKRERLARFISEQDIAFLVEKDGVRCANAQTSLSILQMSPASSSWRLKADVIASMKLKKRISVDPRAFKQGDNPLFIQCVRVIRGRSSAYLQTPDPHQIAVSCNSRGAPALSQYGDGQETSGPGEGTRHLSRANSLNCLMSDFNSCAGGAE